MYNLLTPIVDFFATIYFFGYFLIKGSPDWKCHNSTESQAKPPCCEECLKGVPHSSSTACPNPLTPKINPSTCPPDPRINSIYQTSTPQFYQPVHNKTHFIGKLKAFVRKAWASVRTGATRIGRGIKALPSRIWATAKWAFHKIKELAKGTFSVIFRLPPSKSMGFTAYSHPIPSAGHVYASTPPTYVSLSEASPCPPEFSPVPFKSSEPPVYEQSAESEDHEREKNSGKVCGKENENTEPKDFDHASTKAKDSSIATAFNSNEPFITKSNSPAGDEEPCFAQGEFYSTRVYSTPGTRSPPLASPSRLPPVISSFQASHSSSIPAIPPPPPPPSHTGVKSYAAKREEEIQLARDRTTPSREALKGGIPVFPPAMMDEIVGTARDWANRPDQTGKVHNPTVKERLREHSLSRTGASSPTSWDTSRAKRAASMGASRVSRLDDGNQDEPHFILRMGRSVHSPLPEAEMARDSINKRLESRPTTPSKWFKDQRSTITPPWTTNQQSTVPSAWSNDPRPSTPTAWSSNQWPTAASAWPTNQRPTTPSAWSGHNRPTTPSVWSANQSRMSTPAPHNNFYSYMLVLCFICIL